MSEMRRIKNQILQKLYLGNVSVYELIDSQDASLKEFFEIIQSLEKDGLIFVEKGMVGLTEKGLKECELLNLKKISGFVCNSCDGTGYKISDYFKDVFRKYSEITKDRPEAIEKYDQGFISLDGVIKRVEFIYERGDLVNSKIFVVGDDDLLSIAASLTGLPKEVVVVDIDDRLIDFISDIAEEYKLPIEAIVYDVQKSFPEKLKGKFDVFVTDPVETIPGLKLFLSRGVSTLKGIGCSGYFGITTLEASRKKWYEIQKIIHDMGFIITDLRRRFNVYPQDDKNFFRFQDKLPIVKKIGVKIDYNWYRSSLYRIEAVRQPKPVVEGEMIIDEKVYKDDESWATPY